MLHGPNLHHTTCGTFGYLAPEVVKNDGYDGNLADIWSCGVILFFMLTGRRPFENEDHDRETMFEAIRCAAYKYTDDEESFLSKEVRNLIQAILNPNARKRFSL